MSKGRGAAVISTPYSPKINSPRHNEPDCIAPLSAEEARALWSALADRFAACKLALHPIDAEEGQVFVSFDGRKIVYESGELDNLVLA
jgi:hypothetical protein